jgi:DNA-binding transcriptional MocR family regulator
VLKVNTATVAAAYRLLQGRGFVAGDGRRGTTVLRHGSVQRRGSRGRGSAGPALIDLASGNPDPNLLPTFASAWQTIPSTPVLYGARPELRGLVTFAKSEFESDGIGIGDVLVCGGGLDGIERVLREHLRAGDRIVIEDPCYPALRELLAGYSYSVEPLALDADGPRVESLRAALARNSKAVILTPRAQNPTGAAFSAGRATELCAALDEYPDVLLIENDPLGPIAGARCVTLTAGRRHWAVVRSTSKFLGPDLRMAVLAGDSTTVARVRGRQALGVRWVSHLLQQLALSLWSDPTSGRHLARVADTYARRRTALVAALAEHDIAVAAASGYNLWIPVGHESSVLQQLEGAGWAVAAGEAFRLRAGPGIRVTTSALEPDESLRFARDLAAAIGAGPPVPA